MDASETVEDVWGSVQEYNFCTVEVVRCLLSLPESILQLLLQEQFMHNDEVDSLLRRDRQWLYWPS